MYAIRSYYARDGQVGLDPAARIEHLGVGDPPGRTADVAGADPRQRALGILSGDLELGEGALVEQSDPLPAGPVLLADGIEPVLPPEGIDVLV